MSLSKRYKEANKTVDKAKVYSIEDGVEILKAMPATKFDETLEISGRLGVDPKQSDQMVRGSVVLPNGTGKQVKVLVFCEPEKQAAAKEAGADYIGSEETITKILKEGWADFDCCVSTPSEMKNVSKLGRFLGPRGLMPSPKTGTVTDNVAYAVEEAKKGKIDFRMDKNGCFHVGVGKLSFTKEKLVENVKAFRDALIASKPKTSKGEFINEVYLCATMSPSLKVAF